MKFENKHILVTGGTGSVGKHIVRRLLDHYPGRIVVFSNDEPQQHDMRHEFSHHPLLDFQLGDIREYSDVFRIMGGIDIVFHAAALKYVPICEYAPSQAIRTNILGAENIVRAVIALDPVSPEVVVGISTDKACRPVSVMGLTKALQDKVLIHANTYRTRTRYVCARFGNILTSRGSVLQLFMDQIERGGPVTITHMDMTRFLISLDEAVDVVFAAAKEALSGETIVPQAHSARIVDVIKALCGKRKIPLKVIGLRPGEKLHETLINEQEIPYTRKCPVGFAISSSLPELAVPTPDEPVLDREYSSEYHVSKPEDTTTVLFSRILQ